MRNFLKRLRTKFVEPINVFEQLEERIVLNATINQVVVDGTGVTDGATATVDQGHATPVDADAASDPGTTYSLEVDGKPVDQYNGENGAGADVDVSTQNFTATGQFTWQPNNTDVGTHAFIVTANDGGAGADPHTDAHSFSIAVQNINDAPTLAADGPYVLTSITENDTSAPVTVATIVGSTISDIDAGAVEGIAIYGETHGHAGTEMGDGTWQYSTDGQATWHDFPSVGDANALLLRAEDSVRYVGDTVDGETASLSYYSWDQTGATAGQQGLTADVSVRGDATPFSVDSDSASISVSREVDFTSPAAGSVFTGQEDNPIPSIDFHTDDKDAGLPVTYTLTYASSGLNPGWLDIDANGHLSVTGGSGTPENEQVGTHDLRVTAHTAYDDVVRDFTLQVTNRPAVFDPSSPPDPLAITFLEDRPFQNFDVNTDDESHGAAYDFSTTHPAWLTLDPSTGILGVSTTDSTPTKDHLGIYTFTVKANDGHADSFQNYELTVADRNYFLANDGSELRTDLGQYLTFTKTEDVQTDINITTDSERDSVITHYAFLVDPSFGGTVSADGRTWTSPFGLEVKIDDTTGNITANPINSDVGEQWLRVTATSGGSTIETRVQLTIVNDNRPGDAPKILNEETTVYMVEGSGKQTFNVQADDEGQNPRLPSPGAKYYIDWFDRLGVDGNRIDPVDPVTELPNGIKINADTGVVEWDPTNADFTINAGAEHTPHEIRIVFTDGNGAQDDQVFQIYVSNRPIVFSSAAGTTWVEDLAAQTYDVETTEPDDAGGYVTYELRDAYSPGNPGYIDAQHLILATDEYPTGWVTLNHVTGELTHILGQPDNSLVGSYSFFITATEVLGLPADGRTYSTEQQFTLTISNTPPVLDTTVPVESGHAVWPPQELTVTEGTAKIYTLELESPEPGAVFSIVGGGPDFNGALPGGQITFTPVAGSTQWTMNIPAPDNSDVDFYPLTLKIDDGNGGIVYQMFTLHVINKAPVITTTSATYTVMEDDPQWTAGHPIVDIQADEEGDGGPSYYRITSGPGWLQITNDGMVYGTPDNTEVGGPTTFRVTFYDGHGGSDFEDFSITVNNNQPSLTQPASRDFSWTEDAGFNSYNIQFDDEGQGTPALPYSFTFVSGPLADWSWLTFSTATGTVSGVPTNLHVGDWVFQVTFNDGNTPFNVGDESNLAIETITLHVVNTAPVFTTGNTIRFGEVVGQTFDVHTTDEAWDRGVGGPIGDGNRYEVREGAFGGAQGDAPSGLTPGWLLWNSKTGLLTLMDATEREQDITVWFSDGSVWRHDVIHVVVNNEDAGGTTLDFSTPDNTRFLEDEDHQVFDVQYKDEALLNGTTSRYTLSGAPSWLQIDASTGVIRAVDWDNQPDNRWVGVYNFDISVVGVATPDPVQHFTLTVEQVNPWWTTSPVSVNLTEDAGLPGGTILASDASIQNMDEGHGNEAGEAVYRLIDRDTDGDGTVEANELYPRWLIINASTGELSYDESQDSDPSRVGPTNGDVGSWTATLEFDDGHGGVLTRALPVTVQNTLNFVTGPGSMMIQEDSGAHADVFQVLTNDEQTESPGTVSYSLAAGTPSWVHLDQHADHTWWLSVTGDGPNNSDVGTIPITIQANDGHGTNTQVFTFTVANRDPVYDQTTYETTDQNDKYDFHVVEDSNPGSDSNIIDFRGDDELEAVGGSNPYYVLLPYDANGNGSIEQSERIPDWVTIDPITGILTTHPTNVHTNYDPLANGGLGAPVGGTSAYQFVVRMYDLNAGRDFGYPAGGDTDGITGHTDKVVDLYVDNRLPQLVSTLPVAATEDAAYSFDFTVDDEGQAGTTYTLSAPAAVTSWLSIDSVTGLLKGNPTNADVGVFPVTILVNDQKGSAGHSLSQWSFDMTVTNVDPTVKNPPSSVYGTSATAYQLFFAEDANFIFIDMLSDDDSHNNLNNSANVSPAEIRNYVYYTIETDPLDSDAAPYGVRFVADATYPGAQPSDAYGYYESRTGLLKIDPNNSTVAAGGIVFAVTVHDGNGGTDKVYFDIEVTNTQTVFETGSQLQWYEDNSLNTPNVSTEDERFPRLRDPNIQYQLDTDAPAWLTIDPTTGVLGIKPGVGADGLPFSQDPNAPDNHLTVAPPGGYDFHIRFFDGTMWIGGVTDAAPKLFHLEVWNDPTQITVHPGNQVLNQDATMHITGAEVVAKDEYSVDDYLNDGDPTNDALASVLAAKYTEDSYEIYVDWKDAGVNTTGLTDHTVLPVDLANALTLAQYNTQNDAWDPSALNTANDITFVTDTGEITWRPNNGDVYAAGQGHEFIIVHRDGHGTLWWENFFVKVNNVDPSWSNAIPDWNLVEDLANPADPWGWQKYDYLNTNEEGETPFRYHLAVNGTEVTASGTTLPDPAGADQYDAFRSGSFLVIKPNVEGEYLIFNPLTGEIFWKPNNADVTRNIDPNDPTLPTVPGTVIRPDLDLHAWVEDGQGGASLDEYITVTVNNKTTTLTGSVLPDGTVVNDTANPVPDIITVTEDRDDRSSDKAFLVDVNADDEDVDHNNAAGLNARYQFEVYDDIAGVSDWRIIDPVAGYTPNTGGATITVADQDSGRLDWLPNNIDAGQTGTTVYQFRVTHFDGNNASDVDPFNVTVTNTAPDFTVVPGAAGYVLTEDAKVATAPTVSQIQIDTDDELQKLFGDLNPTGVTYAVYYMRQTTPPGASDLGWISVPLAGTSLNANGGTLSYDHDTGTITWETTNADVNYRWASGSGVGAWISGASKYWFKVEATDHHDTSATSTSPVFEVKVENVKPEILEVKYTDVDHPADPLLTFTIPAGASNTVPANATPFPEREDQQFVLDFWSNDEEIQTGYYAQNVSYPLLEWKPSTSGAWTGITPGGYLHPDPDGAGPLQAGGLLTFDTQLGIVQWDPNNRDVGTWDFRITHNDANGQTDVVVVRVAVNNRLPQWEVDPPATWNLLEDDDVNTGGLEDWTISGAEVKVDDELLGATYSLVIDGTPFSGTLSGDWLTGQPNGDDGGELKLNVTTGAMEWATRNADVGDYTFVMTATDQWGGSSTPKDIAVHVTNETTSIQEETATGVYQDIPATKDATEDSLFTMNLHARDEEIEASPTTNPHFGDARYDLTIDGTSVYAGDPYVWNDPSYTYTFGSGSVLTFDKDTGVFNWTPNDSDVGTHTFVATHYDGQGDNQTDTFNVVVNNTNPRFQPQPTTVILTEDLHTDPNDRFTVQTDDETEGGVTYSLLVSVDGGATYKPLTGVGGWNWTDDKPNGALGGAITIVNAATGDFEWSTTNADTSYNNAGTVRVDPAYSYFFRVVAADTHGGSTTSDPFEVIVRNTNTVIDQVSFTGVLEVPADAVIPTSPDVDTDVVIRNATEDVHVFIDVRASDENHDNFGANVWNRDARYEVEVWYQAPSGTLTYMDTLDAGDLTYGQSAAGGLNAGGVMTFNKDAGTIDWTPNNRDVGTWELRYTHIDANGDTDKVTVNLTVNNRPPQWETAPVAWDLLEDDHVYPSLPNDWTLEDNLVKVDDELTGATYSLQIGGLAFNAVNFPGTYIDGATGEIVGNPNGALGGELRLDPVTGRMSWTTSNADVGDYTFTMTATDQWGGTSTPQNIAVHVANEPTVIDRIYSSGFWYETDTFHHATEFDSPFPGPGLTHIDARLHATDQEVERVGLDTYYDLTVNGVSWTAFNGTNGMKADIVAFNKDTGAFDWTPNNLDTGNSYTFELTHYDANGAHDTESFTLTVTNVAPTLTVPVNWDLYEDDSTTAAHYQIPDGAIDSDQEHLDLYYRLWITNPDGTSHEWTAPFAPNSGGGLVQFNAENGEIVWYTNNADVSVDIDDSGTVLATRAYTFTVQAWDNRGGHSVAKDFPVHVYNAQTSINDVPDQSVDEDSVLHIADADVYALDERTGGEAYYTLEVVRTGSAPGLPSVVHDYHQVVTAADDYNKMVTATGGASIKFDSLTGEIDWAPKNPDVGTYTFVVTHHDGHGSVKPDTLDVTVKNVAPVFTSPTPQGQVVMATKTLTYDASTTDEGQHDWRGDDNVTYSMVQGPASMTIDPNTGLISWQADPALGGTVTVTIKIDDGNGGVAYQTFSFTVDTPVNDLPLEHRPGQGEQPGPFPPGILTGDEGEILVSGHTVGGLLGSTPMTTQIGALVPGHVPLSELAGKTIEEVLGQGMVGFEDLLAGIEQHNQTLHRATEGDLLQPSLRIHGSISPIVGLPGYPPGVAQGSRLDYSEPAIADWTHLKQPSLGIGGSISPHTPLEGHAAAVEAGQQLDFGYFPIREALALRLEDLKVSDLLGI